MNGHLFNIYWPFWVSPSEVPIYVFAAFSLYCHFPMICRSMVSLVQFHFFGCKCPSLSIVSLWTEILNFSLAKFISEFLCLVEEILPKSQIINMLGFIVLFIFWSLVSHLNSQSTWNFYLWQSMTSLLIWLQIPHWN